MARRLLWAGILLLALGAGAVFGVGDGGVELRWTVLDTSAGPVSGWLCTGPTLSASVVMVHSTAQPRAMSEPMARAVARRGFLTFVPSPGGNPLVNAITLDQQRNQVVAAVGWCRERGPARGRPVYLAGHSVGANQAALAAELARPDGVIALGYDVEASPQRSWNLLLAAGVYDQLHPAWQMREVLGQATGQTDPRPGSLYGSPAGMFMLSPLSDHHNEPLDPVLLGATADWVAGQGSRPPSGAWSVESLRVGGAVLICAGLFLSWVGLTLALQARLGASDTPRGRWLVPGLAAALLGLCWWAQGVDGSGETRFFADAMLVAGLSPLVARAGWPAMREFRPWLVALTLMGMAWASWTATAVLNGLPGLRMQPGSMVYLPLFLPWTALTDFYQLRAVAQALLIPWLPLGMIALEAIWPGAVGRALGSWITGLARAVGTFQVQLTVRGSGSSWVALLVVVGVAGLAWLRVMSEGYDFNLTSLMNLLGLLARVALLPLALLVLMLRTSWARRLLSDPLSP